MIDLSLFTVESLVAAMLDDRHGNVDPWRKHAEILPAYVPPFADPGAQPQVRVRLGNSFLRYSCGPGGGFFWDVYGDDFLTPELALLALYRAPVPPTLLRLPGGAP